MTNPLHHLAPVRSVASAALDSRCKVCEREFPSMQECLKHELLEHSLEKKKCGKRNRHNKVISVLKSAQNDEAQREHAELQEELDECGHGQELATILQMYRIDTDDLDDIYRRINGCLEHDFSPLGSFKIYPFGSIVSGLALRDSDIDIFLELSDYKLPRRLNTAALKHSHSQINFFLKRVSKLLYRSSAFTQVYAIRTARVPIVKCKHISTGFSIDINVSCPSSVGNTQFIREVVHSDPRIHELFLFLKIWAKRMQIIGRGNLTSYCLTVLVIFYLQQPLPDDQPFILLPVNRLQEHTEPRLIQGVNYAYDLTSDTNRPQLAPAMTTKSLIKGFFAFYKDFRFEEEIVAPHVGTTIPIADFKSGEYHYEEYEDQLAVITEQGDVEPDRLLVERCMCVQDPFCLNINIAHAMMPPKLDYLRNCIREGHNILEDPSISSDAELYETLLFGTIERMAQSQPGLKCQINQPAPKVPNPSINCSSLSNQPGTLKYSFTPGRAEMRALAATQPLCTSDEVLHRLWVQQYIEAVKSIITEIYRLDMQTRSPTHNKYQRLECADLTYSWIITGSVDLWTGRLHQRSPGKTFMEYQLEQTERLHKERRQNCYYAVNLNGVLSLNIICNHTAIELTVAQHESAGPTATLCKKDPLRRFFAMFKCTLQTFNLKERLQTTQTLAPLSEVACSDGSLSEKSEST